MSVEWVSERGLDCTSVLFIKSQFYCGHITALQNSGILFYEISVNLMRQHRKSGISESDYPNFFCFFVLPQ